MVKAGLKKEKITYIPNFVSKEDFFEVDDKKKKEIRKKYNLKENDFVVIGAGQVQTRKGVLDFIDVAKKMPDVKFLWAGGFSFGHMTDGYEELKKIMDNPPENVQFLGIVPRSEMNNLYNISNVLFVPSYNELFPMTILEAMSSGTPLLLRNLDLYEDILFKKYLSADNNDDFVKALDLLKNNSKEYEKAKENSREISKFYSKEHVLEMWKKLYKGICE